MTDKNVYEAPESNLSEESELIYAGFWIRVVASIIDSIIVMLITAPLLTSIYGLEYWDAESFISGNWDIIISYVFPAIAVIVFWLFKSATPGKMMLGLHIISLGESQKLSVGQSIGRYFAYFPSILVFFLGIFWVAFDKKKKGWHDKIANTAVVKMDKKT